MVWPLQAYSFVDINGNGLSDIYEYIYFGGNGQKDGDADGDSVTNRDEMIWGTDPLNPQSTIPSPELHRDGNDLIIEWTGVAEKQYVLQESLDLITWIPIESGTRFSYVEKGYYNPDETNAVVKFFRVRENLIETDNDRNGLSDWEDALFEKFFGYNPSLIDTDGDGINDAEEFLSGSSPNKKDNPAVRLIVFTPLEAQ